MNLFSARMLQRLAVLGILSVVAGCWSASSTPTANSPAGPTPASSTSLIKPLLAGWEPPAVALMLSGETLGYMEPCGCSLTQSGGLERRGHLQRQLAEKDWNVVAFDAGGLLKRTRQQDRIKFETILTGLKKLGYAAIAAGDSELRLPPDLLLSLFSEGEGIPLGGMLTARNVVFFDSPELGVPKPWQIVNANGVKIAMIAAVGKSVADNVAPPELQHQIRVDSAVESITAALSEIEAEQPDLMLLVSHGSTAEAKALAEKFPQFPAVLATGGPEDPADQPTKVGDTLILQTGHKGKYVGILGFYPNATPRLKWELVNLDNQRFHGDDRMRELMRLYQRQLEDLRLAESDDLVIAHPSGDVYVGAEKCGECHKKAYKKWSGTKHAHAFETLERGRKGEEANWISRIHDPECLACHVTGWDPQNVLRYDSGYLNAVSSPHLKGQQCENCHGPGGQHTELEWQFRKDLKSVDRETLNAARAAIKRNYKTAEQQVCAKCHDHENSPQFNFEKFWKEVHHPWKD